MSAPSSRGLVWLLMLGVAVVGSNSLALSPILSDVAADLRATPVEVARANAAYGGATALAALTLGGLVDRLGPARVLTLGLGALSLAMLGSAGATHWAWLAASQAAAGAAAGLVLPATYALATAIAPEGRGAQTLGRVLTGWSVSLVAGVPLSALIADLASWRASYVALAVLLAGAAALLARLEAPAPQAARSSASVLGAARRPGVAPLLAACLLFMTAFYGVYAYLGDHLRGLLGLDAARAGLVVLAYGAGFGVAALGDRLVDRIGPRRVFPPALGVVALVYAAMGAGMDAFAAALALAAAWGLTNHVALNGLVLLLSRAAPERRGAVLALNSAVTYCGALVGAWAFGPLYAGSGFAATAYAAAACCALAALVAALARPSPAAPALAEPAS